MPDWYANMKYTALRGFEASMQVEIINFYMFKEYVQIENFTK